MSVKLLPLFFLISISAIGQSNPGLRFVQNKGQWTTDVDFQAQVPGGRIGISNSGFSVLLLDQEQLEHQHIASHGAVNESNGQTEPINGHYFRINFLGSNRQATPKAQMPLEGHYNYFLGSDSLQWATHAIAFATIQYENVYEGIDLRVSSVGSNLKYDFVVKPGADPSLIKIEYDGVLGIGRSNEDLEIQTAVGSLTELQPFSYHSDGQHKQTVPSAYTLDNGIISFAFPEGYDECRELVVDPLLIFSSYSGSSADNWGSTATPGEHGTLYSAGVTRQELGGAFPATVGAFQTANRGNFDMAIIKYDSAGTRFLYATHLGGMSNDSPQSLVVDSASGDLIVLGISGSPDYPTSGNAFDKTFNLGTTVFNRVLNTSDQWDIVVTRLSSGGDQLIGSTFLGGSGNDGLNLPKQSGGPLVVNYGDEMRGDVITDDTGYIYLSSVTSSDNFPIVNGFDTTFNGGVTDGLVVKMAPDLSSIEWSSYLGGSGFDAAYSLKFDNNKNIVLAGGTTSTDFPVSSGAYQTTFSGIVDGWIARITPDGSAIRHATFTGTISFDQVYFVDLNGNGDVFVYGQTAGHMPITSGVYNNPNSGQFLQKFSSDLSALQFSTVFGSGSSSGLVIPNISPTAFLVNDCDNIYMAGWGGFVNSSSETGFWQSSTDNMPVTIDAYQKTTTGSDFYFMVLNGDATTLVYATYLGGNSSKTHVDGGTSRFDKYGIVYHAVCSGCAFGNTTGEASSDFPTTPNAKSRLNHSANCNNAAFKFDLSSLKALFDTNNVDLTMPGFNNVCFPDSIVFQNISTGGKTIAWDFDDGTLVTQQDTDPKFLIHQYKFPGQYHVKLKITDLSTCSQVDSITKIINYFKENITVGNDALSCEGESFQLTASGGVSYAWTSSEGTFSSSQQSPVVEPVNNVTSYYVTVVDENGCSKKDTIDLVLIRDVRASFQTNNLSFSQPGYNNVCFPDSIRFKNLSVNGESFTWDFGDGTIINQTKSDTASLFHSFKQAGIYPVRLTARNLLSCNKSDVATIPINYFKDQIEVGDDGEICEGTAFQLTAHGGAVYTWSGQDPAFASSEPSPLVRPTHTTQYFAHVTDENGCVRKDTVQVRVWERVDLEWQYRLNGDCVDRPSLLVQNLSSPADEVTFHFDFGDGTTSEELQAEHMYKNDGTYPLKFTAQKKFCSFEDVVQLPIYTLLVPNVFTPDNSPGYNDYFEIGFGPEAVAPSHVGIPVQLNVLNRWGKMVFESRDYKNDWNASTLESGVYYVHLKVGDFATCKTWLRVMK